MDNLTSGGGYINELSRLKAKAIKTPLKFYTLHNSCVNYCKTIDELKDYLECHGKETFKKIFKDEKIK